jgi:hypothetical protein
MQPEFHSGAVTAGGAALPCAACPQGACCRRVCACPGVGSLRVVLRWGLRVVAGLRGGGWGGVLALTATGQPLLLVMKLDRPTTKVTTS